MADLIDRANEQMALHAADGLRLVKARLAQYDNATKHCLECEAVIHPQRLIAMPGARYCAFCQTRIELNEKARKL